MRSCRAGELISHVEERQAFAAPMRQGLQGCAVSAFRRERRANGGMERTRNPAKSRSKKEKYKQEYPEKEYDWRK